MPYMKTSSHHIKKQIPSNVATLQPQTKIMTRAATTGRKQNAHLMVNASKRTTVTTTESYVGLAQHILPKRQQTQCNGTI